MDEQVHPQIYLITPPVIIGPEFGAQLSAVLDAADVACVRLALATTDVDEIIRAATIVQEITVPRDIALVVADHIAMVGKLGLDGVHLPNAAKSVRDARTELGEDAIVGTYCGIQRHAGMNAGEAGADYISFGPVGASDLGNGQIAEHELFAWWSEMIELPVVAEGALDLDLVRALAPVTDFFALGPEVWGTDDPAETLAAYAKAMR